MSTHTLSLAEDRGLKIPPGAKVFTAYVPVERIRLACLERMAIGDVDRAYQRRLQLAPSQPWPPPVGHWDEADASGYFVIEDGRHEYVATLMLGFETILVAWVSKDGRFTADDVEERRRMNPQPYAFITDEGGRIAPWYDYEGKPIHNGDRLAHPDGTEGIVVFNATLPEPDDQWVVVYPDGICLRLLLQVGEKGQGRVCQR